jgi:hypothetical protein
MSDRVKPDFFIVGAPKCGTTALYTYLAAHPGIFMSPVKEPYHFCGDLRLGLPRIADRDDYLALFASARAEQLAGEASVWYLYSTKAARSIREFNPAAKIVAILRSPVDMLFSLYGHYRFSGMEPLDTFEDALAAENDRRAGRRLPSRRDVRETLLYRDVARYSAQLQRYFDEFGRDRVHVILFDDIRARPAVAYRETLEFLGADPTFMPEFRIVNQARQPRNSALHGLLSKAMPPGLQAVTRRMPAMRGLRTWLRRMNTKRGPRKSLATATHAALQRELRGEICALEKLIGRDLSAWRA